MIGEITLQKTEPDWLNFLIESIKTWCMKWSAGKEEENYFLIN